MKKKVLIIVGVLVVMLVAILMVILLNKPSYIVKVSKIDDQSPDRILTVYNEKNEKVEIKRIETLDGIVLCNGINTAVHFGNVKGVKKLKVILKNKSEIVAQVVEEEVD